MAGFLPGLFGRLYILMIVARVKLTPDLAGKVEQHFTSQEKEVIKEVWVLPTLIIFVLGESLLAFSHRRRPVLVLATILAVFRGKFLTNFVEALTAPLADWQYFTHRNDFSHKIPSAWRIIRLAVHHA